jgi:pSer/pThr/pTyr-binding forkhead associated (FHA) protein
MELKLVVAVGEPKGKEINVSRSSTVIGRKPECDIVIASPKVSREHCRIDLTDTAASISDLDSRNGVYVNGKKVKQSALKSGDKLAIGPLGFIVRSGAAAGAAAEEPLTLTEEADSDVSQDINDFLAQLESRAGGSVSDEDIIQLDDDN